MTSSEEQSGKVMSEVKVHECDECQGRFSNQASLLSHKKWKHESTENNICKTCNKRFTRNFNLKRHVVTCKGEIMANIKCSLCNFQGASRTVVSEHYTTFHHEVLVESYMEFSTFEEFKIWKETYEAETGSRFVKTSGSKRSSSGIESLKYVCYRDGCFCSKGKGIRKFKTVKSNKINGYCPAEINVWIYGTDVQIKYIDTHIGHEIDLDRLTVASSEKASVDHPVALKIPLNQILDDICESVTNNELKRVHLLTRKELWNIVDSFNSNHEAVLCKDDCSSVDEWVKHMQSTSNLVRCYKPQGSVSENFPQLETEDFILVLMNDAQLEILEKFGVDCICIDGTHVLNAYYFNLYTLMVLDDKRQGFPCCFLFSNRGDTAAMEIFFKTIKECLQAPSIKPKTFMSDMDETFYNAWCAVFGPVKDRLFCSWDIDHAWRQNLTKIKNREKQIVTYKKLTAVMFETDLERFNLIINHLFGDLHGDPETKEFCRYFVEYINSSDTWAYCFRKPCGINTNMNLENMHRILKYIYFDGKKVKRIDKAIFLLMRFIRDKLFNRLVTLNKETIFNKLADLRNKHKKALELTTNIIQVGNYWNVSSSGNKDIYQVEKYMDNCTCDLRCTVCNSCIHNFACSCIDFSVKWNMCKHIHQVCMFLKKPKSQETNDINSTLPRTKQHITFEHDSLSSAEENVIVSQTSNNSICFEKKKKHLLENLHRILKYIYFDGKKVKRIDKAIFLLMRFIRDKLFNRLVTLNKETIFNKLADLRNKHKKALELTTNIIQVGNYWNVSSSGNKDIYQVEKYMDNCTCDLRCTVCNSCIHNFACSCIDFSVKWNMCKHIHQVCMFLKKPKSQETNDINSTLPRTKQHITFEHDSLSSAEENVIVSQTSNNSICFEKKKKHLLENFLKMYSNIENEEQLQAVAKQIAPLNSIVDILSNKQKVTLPSVSNEEPSNKTIQPQRFTSRKKKSEQNRGNVIKYHTNSEL